MPSGAIKQLLPGGPLHLDIVEPDCPGLMPAPNIVAALGHMPHLLPTAGLQKQALMTAAFLAMKPLATVVTCGGRCDNLHGGWLYAQEQTR